MTSLPKACRAPDDIEANIKAYLGKRDPTARYFSFDYCFNYFQSYRERDDIAAMATSANIELSCLQLGFYLASWGMLRGSTDLLQGSSKHLVPLVEAIAEAPAAIWTIDADSYSDDAWAILDEFARDIRTALRPDTATNILVTKIMLGVFGNVPAFDTNFTSGAGISTYTRTQLRRVERFYRENAEVIDRHHVPTLDFESGEYTHRTYTRAKVIDMIFFIEGSRRQGSSGAA